MSCNWKRQAVANQYKEPQNENTFFSRLEKGERFLITGAGGRFDFVQGMHAIDRLHLDCPFMGARMLRDHLNSESTFESGQTNPW